MDSLQLLEKTDLELLLATASEELLGRILMMNQADKYHNRLNAIELAARLLEMRTNDVCELGNG